MKRIVSLFFFFLLFLIACEESSKTIISVSNNFTATGNGNMVAVVDNDGDDLNLKGSLSLENGMFSVFLADPSGDTIYSRSFSEPGTYKVNELFERKIGSWVLSYSIQASANVSPSGNFDFDIIYND